MSPLLGARVRRLATQGCDKRDPLFAMARVFPQFQRIRGDSRFADIGRRLRLLE
jgi:hypothetical protein